MIFWNLSIVTVLILALIKLLRILWCSKLGRLSHRKFLSGGNTWKTMEIRVFKIKPKSFMVAMATYTRADQWNWIFLNGKYLERKVTKQELQTQSHFENMLWFWRGGTMCPPAWIGLKGLRVHLKFTEMIQPSPKLSLAQKQTIIYPWLKVG